MAVFMALISFSATCLLLVALLLECVPLAHAYQYRSVFLSYCPPELAAALVDYAAARELGGTIVWHVASDTQYNSPNNDSLIRTMLVRQLSTLKRPLAESLLYYPVNEGYPVSGSVNRTTGRPDVRNSDFDAKLDASTGVAWFSLAVQDRSSRTFDTEGGTLYFQDPEVSLLPPNSDPFCNPSNPICWHAGQPSSAKLGMFEAFARLQHSDAHNPLGSLRRVICIGGAGTDSWFEDTFPDEARTTNFVLSATAIVRYYGLSGVDLDYESDAMTHAQSRQFLGLVRALRKSLPANSTISIALMCSREYLMGTRANGTKGFAPGVLAELGRQADYLNLMTYEFHNIILDWKQDGSGRTGFLTNIYPQPGAPPGYETPSVEEAVNILLDQGVPSSRIGIGVPAFGRAVANAALCSGGLFQQLTNDSLAPGDPFTDPPQPPPCESRPPNFTCSGSFDYNYIVDKMLSPDQPPDGTIVRYSRGRVRSSNPFVRKLWHATDRPGSPLNGATALALLWGPPGGESNNNRSSTQYRTSNCHRNLRELEARMERDPLLKHGGRSRVWSKGRRLRFREHRSGKKINDWWMK